MINVLAVLEGDRVVEVLDREFNNPPAGAQLVEADPAILGADSMNDYAVENGALVISPARVDMRKAARLRPILRRKMRTLLKRKVMEALGAETDDELQLVIANAGQAVRDRIARVRARIQAKDTELDALDRAALESFDPETEIDWT